MAYASNPALERQRQADFNELKVSLVNRTSSTTARTYTEKPVLKNQNQTKTKQKHNKKPSIYDVLAHEPKEIRTVSFRAVEISRHKRKHCAVTAV